MTSLVLDAAFAEDFVSEPATGAQLTEVFDLVSAELTAAFGFCPTSAEAVRQMLEPPSSGRSVQLLVRERDQGALVQWWGAVRDRGATRFDAQVRTHPRLAQPVGDRLVRAAWTALLDWIRAELLPSQAEAEVHTSVPHGDETAEQPTTGRRLHL